MKNIPLIVLGLSVFSSVAFSQAGIHDSTFGVNGLAAYYFSNLFFTPGQIAQQSDGKFVIGGVLISLTNGTADFITMRYTANGVVDSSFNNTGIAITNINSNESATAVAIQPDGKIVVAGYTALSTYNNAIMIVRYLEDGTLDPDFGVNGIATIDISTDNDYAYTMTLLPNGKLVVAGGSYQTSSFGGYAFVAELNEDGTLDTGFDADGMILIPVGSGGIPQIKSVTVQNDGKILAAGNAQIGSYYDIFMVRVDTSGVADLDFGTDGILVASISGKDDFPNKIITQPDSKIVVAGTTDSTIQMNFVLRYEADGTPDASFGNNGISIFNFSSYSSTCEGIALQPDEKFVVCGTTSDQYGMLHPTVGRINSTGMIDTTFGSGGFVSESAGEYLDVILQPDEKIIVLGKYTVFNFGSDVLVRRYLNDVYATHTEQPATKDFSWLIYPDPTSGYAMVEYELAYPAQVTLLVTDAGGKILRTFFSEEKSAGKHKEEFTFQSLAPGMYFLQLKANENSSIQKIIKLQ